MKKILIDGRFMEDEGSAESYLKEVLQIDKRSSYYLDDVWDQLSLETYPTHITLIGTSQIISRLGDFAYDLIEIFMDVDQTSPMVTVDIDIIKY